VGPFERAGVQHTCNIALNRSGSYTQTMTTSSAEADLPLVDERQVRAHRDDLMRLAAEHGVSELRFASPGRLVGRVADDRDLLDMVAFDLAAEALLGARVSLFSDRVLSNEHVSQDLVDAQPL